VAAALENQAMSDESVGKTLLVAIGVAFACSLMVSSAVIFLRPMQLAYTRLLQNRVIIETAGLVSSLEVISDREVISRFLDLDARIVELATGEFVEGIDPLTFDQRKAAVDPDLSVAIPDSRDIAQLTRRARFAPVYILTDGDDIERIVLPIHGQGMWSRIYGYISLATDLNTVVAIRFYEHGETPGVGDRIQDPKWYAQWSGKRLYDDAGAFALQVTGGDTASPYQVDSISGATITAQGVGKFVNYWLGDDGFGPFLSRLRAIRSSIDKEG
jgi:Na+-transporting NADH:ubiquinone oxidoreductase subunit C